MRSPRVLFVCLGNICRSPLAEGIFRHMARRAGLDVEIDSAGTGDWHIGEQPDKRAIAAAARHGIDITGIRARKVTPDDFERFDHILAMDRRNLADLLRMAATGGAALRLFLSPDEHGRPRDVPDPYFDGRFDDAIDLIEEGATDLLHDLRAAHNKT